jgi:subtilisin family serine protease
MYSPNPTSRWLYGCMLFCLITWSGLAYATNARPGIGIEHIDNRTLEEYGDSTIYTHRLEFMADQTIISLSGGISGVFLCEYDRRIPPTFSLSEVIDSVVIDGSVVFPVTQAILDNIYIDPDLLTILVSNDALSLGRVMPGSEPGKTYEAVNMNGELYECDLSVFQEIKLRDPERLDSIKVLLENLLFPENVYYSPRVIDFGSGDSYPHFPYRDELTDLQYYLKPDSGINAFGAWNYAYPHFIYDAPVIAIIDGGFGWNSNLHPDVLRNIHPASKVGSFDQSNGWHGLYVTGVTAAAIKKSFRQGRSAKTLAPSDGGNPEWGPIEGDGISGVSPYSQYVLLNRKDETGYLEDYRYIIDSCAFVRILSISWAIFKDSYPPLEALIDILHHRRVLMFAGAGNQTLFHCTPFDALPGCDPRVSAVGSCQKRDSVVLSQSSNYGYNDFVAPGEFILTTGFSAKFPSEYDPDSIYYCYEKGTSLSSPIAAGVAALAMSENPSLDPATIRDIMAATCKKTDDWRVGAGRLDAGAAVFLAARSGNCDDVDGDANGDCFVNYGDVRFLIDFIFKGGPPPPVMNNADANGDCIVNIGDANYIFAYVYQDGPAPLPGCVGKGGSDGWNVISIQQNYPNPFNPTTKIEFSLPQPSEVGLEIFNITGQKVTTLINGPYGAGTHSITWDGRDSHGQNVASGIYFYHLQAEQFSATRKMVMLK